jgi:hypothetical protein
VYLTPRSNLNRHFHKVGYLCEFKATWEKALARVSVALGKLFDEVKTPEVKKKITCQSPVDAASGQSVVSGASCGKVRNNSPAVLYIFKDFYAPSQYMIL